MVVSTINSFFMNAEPKIHILLLAVCSSSSSSSSSFSFSSLCRGAATMGVSAAVTAVSVEGVHVLLCVVVLGLHGSGGEHHLLLTTS